MRDKPSREEIRRMSKRICPNIVRGIEYTNNYGQCTEAKELRAYAIERNINWKRDARAFYNDNYSRDESGNLNNAYYRHKIRQDVVLPLSVYTQLMDYYRYSVENGVSEDVEFFEKNVDHLMTFCSALAYYKGKYISSLYSKRDKTPLYVKLIYHIVGREYHKFVYYLMKQGLLEVDFNYIPGIYDRMAKEDKKGVCRHYNLLFDDEQAVVYQITNRVLVNKAYSFEENAIKEIEYASDNGKTVRDPELNGWISEHFSLSDEIFANRHKDYDGFYYYYSKLAEEGPKYKNFIIGRDKFGDRLYHPLLNLKKEIRQYVTVDGASDTRTIDIKNSHPYFFSLMLDAKFIRHVKHLLTAEEFSLFENVRKEPQYADSITLFKSVTASGNYYSYIKEQLPAMEDAKVTNMIYFYGRVNKRNSIYKFFDRNFSFINYVKYKLIQIGGYKRLCQILQKVESFVMIDSVFRLLKDTGINTLPLHDAFLCKADDYDVVKQTIVREFRFIGVKHLPAFNQVKADKNFFLVLERVKLAGYNMFLNKNILFEELNNIIKSVGINNRVFKDGMKDKSVQYVDCKFESMRDRIEDEVADRYYDLRMQLDRKDFSRIDFSALYEEYKKTEITKPKWYGKNITDQVKINPMEFYNLVFGSNYKTRVKENKYIYS